MKTRTRPTKSAKTSDSTKTPFNVPPTVEEIRQRAHGIFLARGSTPGNEPDDWLRAEQELKQERAGTKLEAPQK
jgi:hypothetical protein